MLPKNIEQKLISELKNKFHDELHSIVLFGSYARGTAQKYSDIDILIILDRKFTNWTERMNLEIELRKKLYRTETLRVLDSAPTYAPQSIRVHALQRRDSGRYYLRLIFVSLSDRIQEIQFKLFPIMGV